MPCREVDLHRVDARGMAEREYDDLPELSEAVQIAELLSAQAVLSPPILITQSLGICRAKIWNEELTKATTRVWEPADHLQSDDKDLLAGRLDPLTCHA